MSLQSLLTRPLTIGSFRLDSRVVLAPMTGLGHIAFREVAAGFGGYGLLETEMCNARALPGENRLRSPVFRWRDAEAGRLVCQIFGADPGAMADAARRIESEGLMGVDINMGCSVAAICKRGYGAALLREPEHAEAIVRAVRAAVRCPVLVKFRSGWENAPVRAAELARRFADAGADALTFHPRLAPDRRTRPPQWSHLAEVVRAVSIPVLGNGNVFLAEDCLRMLEQTGCAGVSLGRIAIARPWIFAELTRGFVPSEDIYERTALSMIDRLWTYYESARALRLYKKYALYLAANFVYGHSLWPKLTCGATRADMENAARDVLGARPLVARQPNIFLFTS